MSALLNVSSKAVELARPLPPLVVDIGSGSYAWIQNGHGFLLHTRGCQQWHPLVDAVGIGGTVLGRDELALLVSKFGRPT